MGTAMVTVITDAIIMNSNVVRPESVYLSRTDVMVTLIVTRTTRHDRRWTTLMKTCVVSLTDISNR